MEDAPEEDLDIKLQTVSRDLIAEFDARLRPFLRKADGSGRVRSRVRAREVSHLVSNLLDPHLPKWLPVLAEAFLEYQQTRRKHIKGASSTSSLLTPFPTAVCKLIYTFCKIRGEKVIVNFLNVETRYLELLLSAIEESERNLGSDSDALQWTWEERYVVLLWLSHLMLAPFDLATISSVYMHDVDLAGVPGFLWPFNPPSITVRILPLAAKYIASPGKERDAAKTLLVRMAMRRDMQELGILQALIDWALFSLHPSLEDNDSASSDGLKHPTNQNPYIFIGVLAFLAGVLSSADASEVEKYSSKVFYTVNATMWSDDGTSNIINSSAVAKKTVIKVMRSISVSKLTRESRDMSGIQLVETTVRYLLRSLSDKDTPVRFAASKALGTITLNLPKEMASQVVAAVLQALEEHVRVAVQASSSNASSRQPPKKDLTSVDPLEWHGLMLALSYLLYRRSPPPESLGKIVQALLLGLSFEQRSASGVSVGANGIAIVQTVDYHAVALRSRAMQDVALGATKLHPQYGVAILEAVLGWRGLGDANDRVRRYAGASYGMITAELARMTSSSSEVISKSFDNIALSIQTLQPRQVEERHGLLLALASVMDQLPEMVAYSRGQDHQQQLPLFIKRMLSELESSFNFIVVSMSHDEARNTTSDTIPRTLLQCWAKDTTVEVRVWILESLVEGDVLRYNVQTLLRIISDALEDYTTDARGDVGSHARLHAIQATKHLWALMADPKTRPPETASHSAASSLLLHIVRLGAEKLDKVRPEAQSTLALALCSDSSTELRKRPCASQDYFYFLLDLTTHELWLHEAFGVKNGPGPDEWMDQLLAGYVTSADTGNEDLVIASRSALCEYCGASQQNLDRVCASLYRNMKARQGQDRVIVPTLEIIAFLLSVGLYQRTKTVDFKSLCLQSQKASYKTGNVRKLIACVKVYGGIANMGNDNGPSGLAPMATGTLEQKRREAVAEARKRLGALMLHPWPRVRTSVVDELWNVLSGHEADKAGRLKGVDWGTAEKGVLKKFGSELGL
ncbi:hypothetical protein SLS64_008172 [Diaporthe eres]